MSAEKEDYKNYIKIYITANEILRYVEELENKLKEKDSLIETLKDAIEYWKKQ